MIDEDDERKLPTRVWVVLLLAGIFICWIGWNTQVARDRTEQIAQETLQYATQTNDCLTQMLRTLDERTEYNKQLDELVDARSAVVDKRAALWQKFVGDLAKISTDLPQAERDRQAAPVIAQFMINSQQVESENAKINADRRQALAERATKQYPDPTCGDKLPGE